MNKFKTVIIILALFLFQGCLVIDKISYEIKLTTELGGTVTVNFENIQSDAIGDKEFEEDKKNLFEYILKSDDFVKSMEFEGKMIKERKVVVEENKLNGKVVYDFEDIKKVEGIQYDGEFYYLTMQLEDSIITTNGELIVSDEYKRILWEKGTREIKFEVYSDNGEKKLKPLSSFYKK